MTLYTIPEQRGSITGVVMTELLPALLAADGARWLVAADIWATAISGLLSGVPTPQGRPAGLNEYHVVGPVWLPAHTAGLASGLHQVIDGIFGLATAPSDEPMSCSSVVVAFDSSFWQVITAHEAIVRGTLGADVESAPLEAGQVVDVGIALEWQVLVGPDALTLARRR